MSQTSTIHFKVRNIDNLHLDVYTIGYKDEGESLLLLLCDGKDVIHSTLTDCYSEEGYNHADKILHDLAVDRVNAFVWTHPDSDHSTGIPAFLGKYDPDAVSKVFLPHGISEDIIVSDTAKKAYGYIVQKYNKHRHYGIDYVSLNEGEKRQLLKFRIKIIESASYVDYIFSFILPNSNVVERRMNSDGKVLLNDYSIFYIVTFNGWNYLFGGDLTKQNVQFIKEDWLENVVFVKAPHHGTNNLENFHGKLISKGVDNVICTCTTFRSKQLPCYSVLDSYKTFSKAVFCTGNNDITPNYNYGCVHNVFNANMKDGMSQCTGNAYEYGIEPDNSSKSLTISRLQSWGEVVRQYCSHFFWPRGGGKRRNKKSKRL